MVQTFQRLVSLSIGFDYNPTNNPPETQTAPTVGTTERLVGTYTLMMVDPDIPPQTAGGPTTELLHWMQSGLVSANTSTTIGGVKVFELRNPSNTTAFASYIGPSPPNKAPQTHRYTQMLLNTTGNVTALTSLAKFAMTRSNFSAVNVVRSSGLTVLAGNSFNVTADSSTTGVGSGNSTIPGATTSTQTVTGAGSSATGKSGVNGTVPKTTNNGGRVGGGGAIVAGLGALIAAMAIL